jgi:hypothetical protein
MKPIKGKFYSWFYDEDINEALDRHFIGYNSIIDAIQDSIAIDPDHEFRVIDHQLNVVYDSRVSKS